MRARFRDFSGPNLSLIGLFHGEPFDSQSGGHCASASQIRTFWRESIGSLQKKKGAYCSITFCETSAQALAFFLIRTRTESALRAIRNLNLRKTLPPVAALSASALYLVVSVLAASILSTPRRTLSNQTPAGEGLTYQDVSLASRDAGIQIAAWYIPDGETRRAGVYGNLSSSDRVLILVPGKDSSRTSEFGNRFLDFARQLHQRGFSILMIDLRGHGASSPSHITFGLKEKHDVEGAVDWLKSKGYRSEKHRSPGSIARSFDQHSGSR